MVTSRPAAGERTGDGTVPGATPAVAVPRLVVAAASSGSGKTTVATGLMAAFAAQGLSVSPHKVGPDYIDPGYHALATGRPGRNLDPFLCGGERIAPLFLHGAAGCELAVVEGVMGLFDGASGYGGLGSTAQVAKLLRAPVVLVVDAAKQGRSVAALVHGFASWDPEVRLAAVVLNRVGSDRHEEVLRDAMDEAGVPVLGVLRRADALAVPSRHLGLVPAAERHAEALRWVRTLAEQVRAGCDLAALWSLARSAPPLRAASWSAAAAVAAAGAAAVPAAPWSGAVATVPGTDGAPTPLRARAPRDGGSPGARQEEGRRDAPAGPDPDGTPAPARRGPAGDAAPPAGRGGARPEPGGRRPVVAVAAGAAFTFAYQENTELLAAAGADVAHFDPLKDESLPEGTAGLVLGGGFPEVHAAELSANAALRKEVAAFRGPLAAECAGLLYLVRSLDGSPMCGVLDATATMTARLTLGYRQAVALGDSVLAAAGTRVRGHEFHRTAVEPSAGPAGPAWGLTHPAPARPEGFVQDHVHASYLHVHWAAEPSLARRFVERCTG
jgi:cobyrinic acid a,c-diamide synthase